MRVLVTGASGFIGRHLVDRLLAASDEHEVLGVARSEAVRPDHDRRLSWIRCDLCTDPSGFTRIVRDWRPDVICHLAAESSAAATDRSKIMAANVGVTRCVFEAAASLTPAPRTLLASSGYVYGECDLRRPAREGDATASPEAMGPYALSKLRAEAVAAEYPTSSVVIRTFNCTGPWQSERFAIPGFCRSIALAEAGRIDRIEVGNLSTMRDLTDVRDVAEAYRLIIEQGRAGEVFNVASGRASSMRHYLATLLAMSVVDVPVVETEGDRRVGDTAVSVGDASRLLALTGWAPKIPIGDTLRETLDHWRSRL